MAKYKGFELKKTTMFLGHEEEPLMQGTIYYKGKEVGFYSQGDFGREDTIRVPLELEKQFAEFTHPTHDFITGLDAIFMELVALIYAEKDVKGSLKKGCHHVAILPHTNGFEYSKLEITRKLENPKEHLTEYFQKKGDTRFKLDEMKVYSSLNDFIVE